MGLCDAVPVAAADAEYRGPTRCTGCSMHPEYIGSWHAEEASVGRILLLFPAYLLLGQDGELSELVQAFQVFRVHWRVAVELAVEAGVR